MAQSPVTVGVSSESIEIQNAREDNLRHDLLGAVHVLVGAVELLLTTRLTLRQRRYVNVCKRAAEGLMELGSRVPSNPGTVASARRLAIDDLAELGVRYLPKPVTRGTLVRTIQSMAKQKRPRVLIADDSEDSCLLIQQYLSKVAQVSVVRDGQSALDRYQAEPFDLLVMDLDMPILDGCSAIRAIRSWEAEHGRAETPVLVLTAHDLISPLAGNEPGESNAVEPDPDTAHLVPGFLAGRRRDVQTILQALTDSDYETIRSVGYMLKGVGGGHGFDLISEIGHRLEKGAERQDFGQIRNAVSTLSNYLDHIRVPWLRRASDRPDPGQASAV